MIISEKELFKRFDSAKKILLIEPPYPSKYPPFALAKMKTYLDKLGGKEVKFAKRILPEKFDLICVTSLFTYYSAQVFAVLRNRGFFNRTTPIIVGGVFASLMPEEFDQFPHVDVYKGYSSILDMQSPDPGIMSITKDEKFQNFSWVFTSRGCPNKCAYCSVWRIEKKHWINPKWKDHILPGSKVLSMLDNNISAVDMNHVADVIKTTREMKLKILVESGVDCKYVTPELAKLLAKGRYARHGMRTAFDRIEEDGVFQKAVQTIQGAGVSHEAMMTYVLFNFNDRPHDADYRASECYKFDIRPYPQCFRPLNTLKKNDDFVGKHWTRRLGKAFRTFWIMKGIKHGFPDTTFGEYILSKEAKEKFKLTEMDIEMWKSNGKKGSSK